MQDEARAATAPARAVLIYDGDCAFCRFWILKWRRTTGDAVEYLPFQDERVTARFPELSAAQLAQAVHLVRTDGSVCSGAEAALRALATNPHSRWQFYLYERSSLIAALAERGYDFVAHHRSLFSRLTRLFWGKGFERSSYVFTRSVFIRSLAVIYLIAFVSLWSQVNGLIGSRGILPARQTMEAVANQVNAASIRLDRYHVFPTFCWFSQSDPSLNLQCAAGAVLAIALFAGLAPAPCLILLWLIYLSLCTISREFLGFQWDNLMLETGFLAIFFAPIGFLSWRNGDSTSQPGAAPSRIVLWLFRWLLFRLMFESGCVKLLSHDVTWRNLTALTFHYETQPLPTWIGWHARQLPLWLHRISCLLMFGIELALPFCVFGPRLLRQLAGLIFIAFQALIFLTGNYCFFNLLTIVLCLPLFDDRALRAVSLAAFRRRFGVPALAGDAPNGARLSSGAATSENKRTDDQSHAPSSDIALGPPRPAQSLGPEGRSWRAPFARLKRLARATRYILRKRPPSPNGDTPRALPNVSPSPGGEGRGEGELFLNCMVTALAALLLRSTLALLVLLLTIPQLFHMFSGESRPRRPFNTFEEWFAPFRSFNTYGLFAVMTRPRYEIVVQGSNDGQTWLDYEFKYKPGNPSRRLRFVAPHQPRLDWQMWFAALSNYRSNPWFVQFCGQLLQNSPDVLALLKTNPFPGTPPRYLRATLYEYHFTDRATRRKTGAWWTRDLKGEYLPVISLRPASASFKRPARGNSA